MKGLGDLIEKIITIITFGQGKRIATYIAKLRGKKDCGCDKRQEYLNKKISFKMEEQKNIKLDWTKSWPYIRGQVSCSCQFDYGYIEVKDKKDNFITETKFTNPPRLSGQLTTIELKIPNISTPSYFNIRFHKLEGGFTQDIKVNIN